MNKLNNIRINRRQRVALFVLPVLGLAFGTLGYWAWNSMKAEPSIAVDSIRRPLRDIPQAELSADRELDKMDLYAESASEDAADPPDILRNSFDFFFKDSLAKGIRDVASVGSYADLMQDSLNAQGLALQNRLEALQQQLAKQETSDFTGSNLAYSTGDVSSEALNRMQLLMHQRDTAKTEDPELQQLSGMLDKIIDIQHPQRIQQAIAENDLAHRPAAYSVQAMAASFDQRVHSDEASSDVANKFYGLADSKNAILTDNHSILAEIHGEQILLHGSTLKLALLEDVRLGGQLIKTNQFLYGVVSLQGDRLHVKINTIRLGQSIIPVALELYDLDGIAGIFIPGSNTKEAVRSSFDQEIQSVNLSSLDESLSAKAIDASIGAAKRLLSQQVKTVKVTLKNGYRVLLKQN